jgi:hypothetical protein
MRPCELACRGHRPDVINSFQGRIRRRAGLGHGAPGVPHGLTATHQDQFKPICWPSSGASHHRRPRRWPFQDCHQPAALPTGVTLHERSFLVVVTREDGQWLADLVYGAEAVTLCYTC